jgi:hypothetical protein
VDKHLTCVHCGLVIGTYEPMIVVAEAGARKTTLKLELELEAGGPTSSCFHYACFVRVCPDDPIIG